MPENKAAGGLQELAERIQSGATVEKVYGEPVVLADRTLIPVAKVAFGFGGGLAASREAKGGTPASGEDRGAGAGGGGAATPVGVLEISAAGTRYIPVGWGKQAALGALAGFALGWLLARRR